MVLWRDTACRIARSLHHSPAAFTTRTAPNGIRSLSLVADHHVPTSSSASSNPPLLILHGLYGARQNWRGLAKGLAKSLDREIVALDLRNHGESPHSKEFSYSSMAEDVSQFVKEKGWEKVEVLGHSMGGKVASALALSGSIPLSHLVVVDISPAKGPISPEFASYLEAMRIISNSNVKSRKEADTILQKWESDLSVRQFLLTNLVRDESSGIYTFRLPIDYLSSALERGEIGDFPYAPLESGEEGEDVGHGVRGGSDNGEGPRRRWDGKTLFMKGAKSKYINRRNIPIIEAFFPQAEVQTLDAGHWVHAEQPKAFVESLVKFFK